MKKILEYIERLPDRSKMMVCLLLSLLTGVADYITGDLSLSLFYLLPIALASWFIGKRAGFFISMMCGAELFIADQLVAPGFVSIVSIKSWNALMEVCYLFLTGYFIYKIRSEMNISKQQSIALEFMNEELNTFNYTVAHDLRQPLNVINSYCQTIKELYIDNLDKRGKDYLQEIYEGTLRMNRLIEALLNFSRMRNVELHREKVDLCALAHEVITMLKVTEPKRQVDSRLADRIVVNADANLLRVVLENLLGNAWKYTGMREEAVIEFGTTQLAGKPVYFVRDNGAGFDKVDADKLFMPFKRLHGSEKSSGFGIGLATVERIIRRHGGRVWAEGEPGRGSIFYFTLGGDRTI